MPDKPEATSGVLPAPAEAEPQNPPVERLPDHILHMKFMLGAMMAAASAMNDLATVITQGVRDDNAAMRGGIAAGFDRAAAYARLQPFEVVVDPKHIEKKEPKN